MARRAQRKVAIRRLEEVASIVHTLHDNPVSKATFGTELDEDVRERLRAVEDEVRAIALTLDSYNEGEAV
jgi:hypothetical protein